MKKTRNSSFELLRIILIIMILIEHGNMWFIGSGYCSEAEHWAKCIVESICIGSVNAFVLISGWFGIRSSLNKIGDLIFMLLFCTIPVLLVSFFCNQEYLSDLRSATGVYNYILGGNNYWFVVDYIGLLIVSPILNRGVEMMNQRKLRNLLIAGYVIIALYDFVLRTNVLGVEGGYSVLWFGYLYLLARYMRLYGLKFINKFRWVILFAVISLQSILFYYGMIGLRYTNPLILLEAVSVIFIFQKWHFQSKVINNMAAGALMAYLLHMQPILFPYIGRFLCSVYSDDGYWLYMIELIGISLVFFVISVGINKLQSQLYKLILYACQCCHTYL